MELSLLFLIELNSTLGHLSWSIRKVSADGAITPTLCQLCLVHRMASPECVPAPLGTDAPTRFLFTMLQFLSLPEDYYLPDKLHCFYRANMNKQALCFLLRQRAWVNESENPKKKSVCPQSISYWTVTQGPAVREADGM